MPAVARPMPRGEAAPVMMQTFSDRSMQPRSGKNRRVGTNQLGIGAASPLQVTIVTVAAVITNAAIATTLEFDSCICVELQLARQPLSEKPQRPALVQALGRDQIVSDIVDALALRAIQQRRDQAAARNLPFRQER